MSLPIPLLTPLAVGLMWAVVCDLRRRRIPNVLSGAVFVIGLAISGYHGGASATLSGLAAAVLLLVALYKPWHAGGIGGGDVKLAAAVGAWIGLSHLIWFALATAVAGGIVAAVCYVLAPRATRADVRPTWCSPACTASCLPRPLLTEDAGVCSVRARDRGRRGCRASRCLGVKCGACCASAASATLNPLRGPSMNPMLSVIPTREFFKEMPLAINDSSGVQIVCGAPPSRPRDVREHARRCSGYSRWSPVSAPRC